MANLTDARCYEGETIEAAFKTDADCASVVVSMKGEDGETEISATGDGAGAWTLSAALDFTGLVRWVAFAVSATGGRSAIASGRIYVRPLVSKWREVVTAIDEAIQSWSSNPNQTVTCGEISITAKTVGDLFAARDRYRALADADENGTATASGPRIIRASFGR